MLHHHKKNLQFAFHQMKQQTDFSPRNPIVNKTLSAFVENLSDIFGDFDLAKNILNDHMFDTMREEMPLLCEKAECEMEFFWAEHFLRKGRIDIHDLKEFWYFDHYKNLCEDELRLLQGIRFKTLTFLGSGPLPMTAILMAAMLDQSNIQIKCVDYDEDAVRVSRALIRNLGLSDKVTIIQEDAAQYKPQKDEVLICASLMKDAQTVYTNLKNSPAAYCLVRDAEGVYQFLYMPAIKPDHQDYDLIDLTTPAQHRINTSKLYRKIK